MKPSAIALALALTCGHAAADVSGDADGPAQLASLEQVGEARLSVLFWDVYDSRLFTRDGTYSAGERPLRLEIEYLLDIKGEDLVKRTRKEWQAQGLSHPDQERWLEQLAALFPDVKENDVLALEVNADGVGTFYCNGEMLGTLDNPTFADQFLAIWLSPDTTRPEVRASLIGLSAY